MEEVKLLPMEDFLWRYPHMLSGGQRQRLGIGRALILGPSLLIADEPVSMLDVSIRAEILELLIEEKQKRNLSYIFITHDLAVARYVCERIAVMYLGRIVEEGYAKTIIGTPCHPYSRALVSAVPVPDPANRFKVKELPIHGEIPSARKIPPACRFHPRCPYVFDRCRLKDPDRFQVGEDHRVACLLGDKLCQ
ncbi:MAG: ABC transporter ATP-binding protein, partial [Candidatus Bathyarchaeia archaeon]